MAKDVDQALRTIAQDEGSMGEDDAASWVKGLMKEDATSKCILDRWRRRRKVRRRRRRRGIRWFPGFHGILFRMYRFLPPHDRKRID